MSDITVTLTVPQAMAVQAALGERMQRMASTRTAPGSFEEAVVAGAVADASGAQARIVEALYGDEPKVARGTGIDLSSQVYEGMEGY